MYRLPFELTDSAKLLHFTILGGSADPTTPLNDATATDTRCYLVRVRVGVLPGDLHSVLGDDRS